MRCDTDIHTDTGSVKSLKLVIVINCFFFPIYCVYDNKKITQNILNSGTFHNVMTFTRKSYKNKKTKLLACILLV